MVPPSPPVYPLPPQHSNRDPFFSHSHRLASSRDLPAPVNSRQNSMSISSVLGTEQFTTAQHLPPRRSMLPASAPHSMASSPTRTVYGHRQQSSLDRALPVEVAPNRFRAYSGGATTHKYRPEAPIPYKPPQLLPNPDNTHVQEIRQAPVQERPIRQPIYSANVPVTTASPRNEFDSRPWRTGNEPPRSNNATERQPRLPSLTPQSQSQFTSQTELQSSPTTLSPLASFNQRFYHHRRSPSPVVATTETKDCLTVLPHQREIKTDDAAVANGLIRLPYEDRGAFPARHPIDRMSSAPPQQASHTRSTDLPAHSTPVKSRLFGSFSMEMERSASFDRAAEGGHRQALLLEHTRRHGRSSPIPQAVHGAQARSFGPSRNPSIKNEFAKMFAGIGTGVSSSSLGGSGPNSPRPPSPKLGGEFVHRHHDLIERSESTNGSRLGQKRPRKLREETATEIERPLTTDPSLLKGAKRVRHHHHHHHHHHPPGHHHHHKHYHDDQAGIPGRATGSPSNSHHHHHHHHADGTIHYHNHEDPPLPLPRHAVARAAMTAPAPASAPPSPEPKTNVRQGPRLKRIMATAPRNHLGSILYHSRLLPVSALDLSDGSFSHDASQFHNAAYTLPRFPGKENHTLTIRVPRFYLTVSQRNAAINSRALWGTGIYTDDSDPIAAAIHSGFLPDPSISSEHPDIHPHSSSQLISSEVKGKGLGITGSVKKLSEKPVSALVPANTDAFSKAHKGITDMDSDLEIKILLHPPLTGYTSTIGHGIKSRAWHADHDGMSYSVVSVCAVRNGSVVERTGRARRERIRALGQSGSCNQAGTLAAGFTLSLNPHRAVNVGA